MRLMSLRCWLLGMSLSWGSLLLHSHALCALPHEETQALALMASAEHIEIHARSGWQMTVERWSIGRQRSEVAGAWSLTTPDPKHWQLERAGVTQHYVASDEGIRHSVYVEQAPAGDGALYFRQQLRSAQLWPSRIGADAILWRAHGESQDRVGAYHGEVLAWDATGRPLPARYELESSGQEVTLSYVIDDALAIYPVVIDPLIYEPVQPLEGPAMQASRRFGDDVAVYQDTMVVGAPGDDGRGADSGALYVYRRSIDQPEQWDLEQVLTSTTTQAQDKLGSSVALNHDTIAAIALGANGGQGQINIFARNQSVMGQGWRLERVINNFSPLALTTMLLGSIELTQDLLAFGYMESPALPVRRGAVAILSRHQGGVNAWGVLDTPKQPGMPKDIGFGEVLAWGDDRALLIGAPRQDSGQPRSGAAYLFVPDLLTPQKWDNLITLMPPQPQADQRFGASAAMAHGRALIGAPGEGAQPGAAYLFERNQGGDDDWGLLATLSAPMTQPAERFGAAVGLIGERAIVSAPGHVEGAAVVGAIYQFERGRGGANAWGLLKKTTGQAPDTGYGQVLALSEQELITGKPQATVQGNLNAGELAHYELERSRWPQRLLPPQASGLGHAVAMSAETILVGAPLESGQGLRAGAAYVYDLSMTPELLAGLTSSQLPSPQELGAGQISAGDRFGAAVALGHGELFIGATQDSDEPLMGARPGKVHVYQRQPNGSWAQAQLLAPPANVAAAHFGHSIAWDGEILYIGAPKQLTMGQAQGAVYVYRRDLQTGQWQPHQTLYSPDPQDTEFGSAVSASGGQLVVGSAGQAHHYKRSADPMMRLLTWVTSYAPGQPEPTFGLSLSLSRERLLIGAPGDDDKAQDAGAVYVYMRATDGSYTSAAPLYSDAPAPGARFGASLAQAERWVLIGEPGAANDGGAQLYEQLQGATWATVQLYRPAAQLQDARHQLGGAVAIFGGVMLLGAPGIASSTDFIPGRLYLSHDMPIAQPQIKTLNAPTPMAMARFGEVVEAQQGELSVSAPGEDQAKGAVYLFERERGGAEAWGLVKRLSSPNPEINGFFGASIKRAGARLFIGAPGELNGKGRVYLFERNQLGADAWGLVRTFESPLAAARFGSAVFVDGATLAIGAPALVNSATDGNVFIYAKDHTGLNQWGLLKTLTPSAPIAGGRFGQQVQLERGRLLVTQPPKTAQGAGVVYLFERDAGGPQQWSQVATLTDATQLGFARSATMRASQLYIGAPASQTISRYIYDGTWSRHELIDLSPSAPSASSECGDQLWRHATSLYASCEQTMQTWRLPMPSSRRPGWLRDHVSLGRASALATTIDYLARGHAQEAVMGQPQAGLVVLEGLEVATTPAAPTILSPQAQSVNTQPATITGQSQPLAWLWLQVQDLNGQVVWSGATQAGDDGAWSYTLGLLPPADYTLSARARTQDKLSAPSQQDFTLASPLFVSVDSPSTGVLLNTSSVMVAGRATPGAMITLTLRGLQGQGDLSATYQADQQGQWQGLTPNLQDGDYELTAQVSDGPAQERSEPVEVAIDTTPPSLVWGQPSADSASNSSMISAQGQAEPDASITLTLKDAQGNVIATTMTTSDAAGQWSTGLMTPLSDGDYTMTVEVTDSAGNVTTQQRAWRFDTVAPTIMVMSPAALINIKTPMISGTTEPLATITATIKCGAAAPQLAMASADAMGRWSLSGAQPLSEGRCDVELAAQDRAGNSGAAMYSFVVDTIAPALTINAPLDNATLSTLRPTISGSVDQVELTLKLYFGAELTPTLELMPTPQGDQWSYTAMTSLSAGSWRATAAAVDAAGNTATAEVRFILQAPTPPMIQHLEPTDELLTNDPTPRWQVRSDIAARLELIVDGEVLVDLGQVQGVKNWDGPYPQLLSDGEHQLNVRAHYGDDQIINTPPKRITIDTTAPALSITEPAVQALIEDNTPIIIGQAEAGLDIEVFIDDVLVGQTKAGANGRWQWSVLLPGLSDGAHRVQAQGQDPAGNRADSGIVPFEIKAPDVKVEDPDTAGDQPSFNGEAPEGSKVTIIILDGQGQEIHRGTTTADADNTWRYKVDKPLPDGDYIVIVEIEQPDGKKKRRILTLNIRRYTPEDFERSYCSLSRAPGRAPAAPTGFGLFALLLGFGGVRRAWRTRHQGQNL